MSTVDFVFAVSEIQDTVYLSVTTMRVWRRFRESQRFFPPEEREALQQQLRFLGFRSYDHILFSSTGGLTPLQVVNILEGTGRFLHDSKYVRNAHTEQLEPLEAELTAPAMAEAWEWQRGAVPL